MEVLLVPPGPDWSSSARVEEKPPLYTQGGVGGLEGGERRTSAQSNSMCFLFYSCRVVVGSVDLDQEYLSTTFNNNFKKLRYDDVNLMC